ncbi:fatty acid desaturase [Halalkalibacter oceani]
MGKLSSLPIMSIIFFIMALFWLLASIAVYGDSLFYLFTLLVPVNLYFGFKFLQR